MDHSNRLCVFCAEVMLPDSSVKCDFCQEAYHLVCCNPDPMSSSYSDKIKLLEFLGWTCRACRSSASQTMDNLRSSITSLSAQFTSLRTSLPFVGLSSQVSTLRTVLPVAARTVANHAASTSVVPIVLWGPSGPSSIPPLV